MKYSANPEILKGDSDAQLAWDAIQPIWQDLPLSPYGRLESFLADLTKGQRALIAVDWCQKEIRNGGFRQLFENSSGNLVPWAIEGLALIGAERYEAVFAEASRMLGPSYPKSGSARKEAYKTLSNRQLCRLDELEGVFYGLLKSVDDELEAYRGSYVRRHADEFVPIE